MTELNVTIWRKSIQSSGGANCVEVGHSEPATVVGVRDTKDRAGGMILLSPAAWRFFIDGIKDGGLSVS
ncbi:DUF397 domain-containing protein [Salinispora arenicola]|uniref:DUF397 domain-containing protein n=1 Tax=Salinispora arenicola TaxID=168697 RepID=UPI00169677A7|nr:DUF397 domain-containing protein [Salinispora arenicola]NIL55611.1 DUF397 domain-containing protein [Salinispora arenicola]NIL64362.1 DUF397 domain-containing protein [Salinispora arenicola]